MMFLIRWIYNLAFPVVLLVLLPGFLVRMVKRGKYRHKFWQRFGIYSPRVLEKFGGGDRIWVHAVSVGEVIIAMKLIQAMREKDSSASFVLSTTTSTGFKLAARAKCPWLEPVYNPLDFFFTTRRAVRAIRPKMLILVEAEVWPNIVCEPYFSMYKKELDKISLAGMDEIDWDTHPFAHYVQSQCAGFDTMSKEDRRKILAVMYGQISFIDKSVGRLVAALKERRFAGLIPPMGSQ